MPELDENVIIFSNMSESEKLLSIVVPVYNESHGLPTFHKSLLEVLSALPDVNFELLYCDDGSTDDSTKIIRDFAVNDQRLKLIRLSRNFGKEIATTAGIHEAAGDAIITLDADGQHPVELIPEFLNRWRAGSKVVIGVRTTNQHEGLIKHYGSKIFYRLFNLFTGTKLLAGASDFRLIDQTVQQDFKRMTERNRITRGLIDWLGYERDYISFSAKPRLHDTPSYSFRKLFKLAVDSTISLSISPLYVAAYIGAIVLPLSILLGTVMVGDMLLGDPLQWRITGSAYVVVLLLFLIGVLLVSQGIIGLYLSHIHMETQNRPLYVIDQARSIGLHES